MIGLLIGIVLTFVHDHNLPLDRKTGSTSGRIKSK